MKKKANKTYWICPKFSANVNFSQGLARDYIPKIKICYSEVYKMIKLINHLPQL